jgi:integrase
MRRGEILALTWPAVHPHIVMIKRSKTGRQRAVPLSPVAAEVLDQMRGCSPIHVFPVFAGPSGDRLLERSWYHALSHAQITGLHFHDLRHEGVSRLFEKGLSLPEVMAISGHRTTSMAVRYAHLQVEHLVEKLRVV